MTPEEGACQSTVERPDRAPAGDGCHGSAEEDAVVRQSCDSDQPADEAEIRSDTPELCTGADFQQRKNQLCPEGDPKPRGESTDSSRQFSRKEPITELVEEPQPVQKRAEN